MSFEDQIRRAGLCYHGTDLRLLDLIEEQGLWTAT